MGIIVPEATLPMGVTLSNVYISFAGELVHVIPGSNLYTISSNYKVYKDSTKDLDTNIRVPISVGVTDISVGVYHYLYEKLKQSYPNSIDDIQEPVLLYGPDLRPPSPAPDGTI